MKSSFKFIFVKLILSHHWAKTATNSSSLVLFLTSLFRPDTSFWVGDYFEDSWKCILQNMVLDVECQVCYVQFFHLTYLNYVLPIRDDVKKNIST